MISSSNITVPLYKRQYTHKLQRSEGGNDSSTPTLVCNWGSVYSWTSSLLYPKRHACVCHVHIRHEHLLNKLTFKFLLMQAWLYLPVVQILRNWRQEDQGLETSLASEAMAQQFKTLAWFHSQHPNDGSLQPVTPISQIFMPSSDLWGHQAHIW